MAPLAYVSTKRNSSENECTGQDNEKFIEISKKNIRKLARDTESARSKLTGRSESMGSKLASPEDRENTQKGTR